MKTDGKAGFVKSRIWDTLFTKLKQAYKRQGIGYILKTGSKMAIELPKNGFLVWYYRKFMSSRTFTFQGKKYHYLIHPYCSSWKNERAVVIPIMKEILDRYESEKKCILEVGNTLSYIYPVSYDILDKYEIVDGVINEDVVDFNPSKKYDLIFSVVSMQHIGWDEIPREPTKIIRALKNLNRLLTSGGQLIVGLGWGYNPEIDKLLKDGSLYFDKQYYLKRISGLEWEEVPFEEIENTTYDVSVPTSTGIAICLSKKK